MALPDQSVVKEAILKAQDWIVASQKEDGLFVYLYDRKSKQEVEANNIVRQIGTFWSLCATYSYNYRPQILKSINDFRAGIEPYIQAGEVAEDNIAYIEFDGLAKVNSASLYILALASLQEQGIILTNKEKTWLPQLVRGIQKMALENGGFYYLYFVPAEKNRVSIYGSGQALYALQRYNQVFLNHNQDLQEFINFHFEILFNQALEGTLEEEPTRAFVLWGLYILNEGQIPQAEQKIRQLLQKLNQYRKFNQECTHHGCILAPEGKDPALLEGLTKVLKTYPVEGLFEYQAKAVDELLDRQIQPSEGFGAGAFCKEEACETLRIDRTQHGIMALNNLWLQLTQ